jgi:hypothetical protein
VFSSNRLYPFIPWITTQRIFARNSRWEDERPQRQNNHWWAHQDSVSREGWEVVADVTCRPSWDKPLEVILRIEFDRCFHLSFFFLSLPPSIYLSIFLSLFVHLSIHVYVDQVRQGCQVASASTQSFVLSQLTSR